MLQFFRNIFKTKLGLLLTFAFLALIALAFATADVANTGSFGGVAGGDRVAVVGDTRISTAELTRAAGQALDRARREDPTLSMPAFIAQGGLDEVLNQLIDRTAIAEYARSQGFRAGDNLINSEIRQIAAFRGPDGNFSPEIYQNAITAQGLNDAMVRDDLRQGLLAQLMLEPATIGVAYPQAVANRYALLFKERRIGTVGFLPSSVFAPTGEPDQATLARYYQSARTRFIRPERRVIRYAVFGPEAVEGSIAPTPAAIAARYERDMAQYAARELRSFTQLIVPTQAAAEAIRQRVAGGGTLEAAAQAAGLRTSQLASLQQAALSSQASQAVAAAYFGAAEGALTTPARSPLGWHVARVDAVRREAGQTLAQATPDITAALTEENRAQALADLSADIEQRLDEGGTLAQVAQSLELTPQSTAPVIANGMGYGGGPAAPPLLAPALATAFQMDESSPQLAQLPGSDQFLIFEVTNITPSAVAPLAEIRNDVVAAWRQSEGARAAKAAADRILAKMARGSSYAEAAAPEKPGLPAPESINLSREELAARRERVAPPLALMFSMAQGTAKPLEAARNEGWYVVDLDRIELGTLAPGDPLAAQARSELATAFTGELTQQAVAAIRKEVGVEINPAAVDAVRKQLTGAN
ncbi:MAG TPA: SurA N-terminal domain-containing protein [Qipengyuania sp.]|nr:SurA N-terminal domain-containing protein [Qipengyuania sp.]